MLALVMLPVVAPSLAADRNDGDAVVAAAEAAVRTRLADAPGAQLTVTGRPQGLALPTGDVTFSARPVTGNWPRRRFVVAVDVLQHGHAVRTVPVSFELSTSARGWLYSGDLRSHAIVDDTVTTAGDADIAKLHGTPVQDVASLAGLRLRRGVHAGDVAVMEDFEKVPDIDIRQRVRVIASQGAIRLESGGLALASGNRGDVVSVRVDGGEQPVRATVIDKGVTQVVH